MQDRAYRRMAYRPSEIKHAYGKGVHILADPVLVSRLLRLSVPETLSIEGSLLLKSVYRDLIRVAVAAEFPRTTVSAPTRMAAIEPDAVWSGEVIDPSTLAVSVGVARAGLLSSQVCYEEMGHFLEPANVRQDFLMCERKTGRGGKVLGAEVGAAKVGGSYADRIVLFPDPMGATGGSLDLSVRYVRRRVGGKRIRKIISLNMVITPEFIHCMQKAHPDVVIYAARLDRGRSSDRALGSMPGKHPREESGLNDRSYIIPGLGGLGEYLNNAEK